MSLSPPDFYIAFAEEAESDIFDTDISEKRLMLFTWTPDPNRYPTSKPHEQYRILLDLVLLKFDKVFSTFACSPELNCNGNVHIHGWYVVKDPVKYFKWLLPKMKGLGFVKVSAANSKKALSDYYKKDIDLMNQLMDEYDLPIPLTHVNCHDYKMMPKKKQLKLTVKKKVYPMYKKDFFQNTKDVFGEDYGINYNVSCTHKKNI